MPVSLFKTTIEKRERERERERDREIFNWQQLYPEEVHGLVDMFYLDKKLSNTFWNGSHAIPLQRHFFHQNIIP